MSMNRLAEKQSVNWLRLVVALLALPLQVWAWDPPAHMLNGSITYQILRRESAHTIETVKSTLEKHPWYEAHWKPQLEKLPSIDRDEMLFMLAPRWADEVRTTDRAQYHRAPWHYINFPFKPDGQPESVRTQPPAAVNILTALAENETTAKTDRNTEKRAVALTWLFHLVGDIHQPLHTVQIFTTDYPNGDRGGNEVCVRPSPNAKPMDLHQFWDDVITASSNTTRLRNEATALRNRPEFSKNQLAELALTDFESWAKESAEIATKFAYENGAFVGTPKGNRQTCAEVANAVVVPNGYAKLAGRIGDRRITLAGYRLASVLERISGN